MRFPVHATVLVAFGLNLLAAPLAISGPPGSLNRSDKPAPGEKKLPWLAFDVATERAKKENTHLTVDVYTTWCGGCKVMERQTHWKGKVMTERSFARSVGVTGFPTTYFLKPDAEMIGGAPGFIGPDNFIIYAKYVSTRWYEKGSPQDYLKATGQDTP